MTDQIQVIGEALVDVVEGGETHPGGSPMNIAVGLSRLGHPTTLHARIGADAYGDLIRAHLDEAGVTLGPGTLVTGSTSTAIARVDAEGKASYEFDIDWDIPAPDVTGARLVHTGSIGALREPGASAVRAALGSAGGGTLLTLDPNIRPDVIGTRDEVLRRVADLAALCHVVKLSDEDAAWLAPDATLEEVLADLAAHGARFVVVTRGSEGCLALVDGAWFSLPARPVVVADTIGAGDAFMSGLLHALLRDGTDRLLVAGEPLPDDAVLAALETALTSAALTVARAGANPPASAELEEALRASRE
ncbi:carbohydrate kinase family protein [Microbacterium azadirachtae]|uniref:Putative sugar kinase YdjH n=1 Tax=Microbacterium azadirachtae TaxID=582680 RepID=A0A0F0LIL9_9MICO|nr:carbohydrate kinase [Microbacterium azadirachtae]KJL32509.1 putative sugar kinase YdjH [Microbacterium azadirachtae]